MKKLLLSLGTIAAVAAPVAAVVSCGDSDTTFKANITGITGSNLVIIKLQEAFGNKISNITNDTKTIKFDIKSGSEEFKKTLDLEFVRTQKSLPTEFTTDFIAFINKTYSLYSDADGKTILSEMIGWFNL